MARKMKDSGIEWIGMIPQDWETKKLKYCSRFIQEKYSVDYGDLPYIGMENIESWNGRYVATDSVFDKSQSDLFLPDDILWGKLRPYLAKVYHAKEKGCCSGEFCVIRLNERYDVRYFWNLLISSEFVFMVDRSTYGTKMPRANADFIKNLFVPVPPFPEQLRIASFLDAKCALIDAAIDKTRASIEEYKKLKQAIITEVVTKGVRGKKRRMKDSGIEWIGEIPEDWGLIKGKYLFQQRNEKGNKIELQLLSPTQKYGVIPQQLYEELSGMTTVKLDLDADYSSLKSIYIGDFCISLRSFQGGFEYSRYNGVVSPAYQVFFKTCDLCNAYYAYLFKEKSFIERMTSYTRSFRDGKNIAFSDFGDSLIPVPPISEQSCIAKYVDDRTRKIREIVSKKENLIQNLINYKKSIIFEYVTGKKEVPA